mmetsp:Transcript_8208/g.14818  ORF Transcript_8208/g.14818 Transcript_8208/m.14818 type:complete len:89 (+) Transcript_8208:2467-2733(+)
MITFEDILDEWFRMHAPFAKRPTQYRSAIFYLNKDQKDMAKETIDAIKQINREYIVYAEVQAATPFYQAEKYHQDYRKKWLKKRGISL